MQGYDLFMLVVLAAAVVWGFWKGFAWQVASIASLTLSYFVALKFRAPMTAMLKQSIEVKEPLDTFLAMLILFLGTSLVVWVAFNLIADVIEKVKLKEFDRQLGALLGMAKGVLLCALITLFGLTLLSEDQRKLIVTSKSGHYIAVLLDRAGPLMPDEVHTVLEPYIKRLDEQLQYNPDDDSSTFSLPNITADQRSSMSNSATTVAPRSRYAPKPSTTGDGYGQSYKQPSPPTNDGQSGGFSPFFQPSGGQ